MEAGVEYYYDAETGFVDLGDKRDGIRVVGGVSNLTSHHFDFLLQAKDMRARGFTPPVFTDRLLTSKRHKLYCTETLVLLDKSQSPPEDDEEEEMLRPTALFHAALGTSDNAMKTPKPALSNSLPIWPVSPLGEYCKCLRSHCLKRYCSCFGRQLHCNSMCICDACENLATKRDGEWAMAYRKQAQALSKQQGKPPPAATESSCKCSGKTKCLKKHCSGH